MSIKPGTYAEASIRVLKGLEPVKQRPGMYTRTDNPLHVVQEVIDNAADEALAGVCKRIAVTLHADGSVSVDDDGRGIPFGLHPQEQVPVLEIVFTRLHAGGKFDKGAGGAYSFSGGLHGVGVSVTNALATRLAVTVWREAQVATLVFGGGDVIEPLALRKAGGAERKHGERKHGTCVRVWPDARYFESAELPRLDLVHLLRSKAVLMPGVSVSLTVEKTGEVQTWRYEHGLRDYLMQSLAADPVIPLFEGEQYAGAGDDEAFAEGEGASWCVAFTDEGNTLRESFVNLIPTVAGGTHESGLKDGLFGAVKGFIDLHALLPKGVKLMPDDVFSRASFVLSAKVLDPQFQGKIKERLNSRDALRLVSAFVRPALELWLNQHVAQPACGAGQEAGRTRHPPGTDAPACSAESREEARLRRGRAARQADRLRKPRPAAQRGLPRRRRQRRGQRQDGAQQGDAGRVALARQGAQHLGGGTRPAVRQHRDPRHRGGHRGRSARPAGRPGPVRSALRQGLHPQRRRC